MWATRPLLCCARLNILENPGHPPSTLGSSRETHFPEADRTAAASKDRSDHGKVSGDSWSSETTSPSSWHTHAKRKFGLVPSSSHSTFHVSAVNSIVHTHRPRLLFE